MTLKELEERVKKLEQDRPNLSSVMVPYIPCPMTSFNFPSWCICDRCFQSFYGYYGQHRCIYSGVFVGGNAGNDKAYCSVETAGSVV